MRFQQGVDDRPTRLPISATEREASSCSTVKILRSMASIEIFFQSLAFATLYIEKYFQSRGASHQEKSADPEPSAASVALPAFGRGLRHGSAVSRPARPPPRRAPASRR